MRGSFVIGATFVVALALNVGAARTSASEPSKRSPLSPDMFGEVFRKARPAMVRLRWTDQRARYATGFVIGAQGELVFGAERAPDPASLELVGATGRHAQIRLLDFDAALGLGVAQILDASGQPQRTEPMTVSRRPTLEPETWTVILRYGRGDHPEPFAGLVSTRPTLRTLTPPKKSGAAKPRPALVSQIEAPGEPGSPVLSPDGELVAVVIEGGRRRTKVALIDSIEPYLRAVVLGR